MEPEKAVLVRYDQDSPPYLEGTILEVVSAEKAWEVHPNARVLRFADGTDYEGDEDAS